MKVEQYILLLSLLYKSCCCLADDGGVASQLVLFKDLPGMDMSLLPVHFNIRSTFKGSVEFLESDEFKVIVNITAPTKEELYRVNYNYTDYHGSLLLQVFESVAPVTDNTIYHIIIFISIATLIVLFASIAFVVLWNKKVRPQISKSQAEDTSSAPLLENLDNSRRQQLSDQVDGNNSNGRPKKKKRKRLLRQVNTGEENVSSEDDILSTSDNSSPSRRIPSLPPHHVIPKLAYSETTKSSSGCSGSNPASNESLTTFSDRSTGRKDTDDGETTPERRVIGYIKMDGSEEQDPPDQLKMRKKKSGYYAPLPTSDSVDIDKQAYQSKKQYGNARRHGNQYMRVATSEDASDQPPQGYNIVSDKLSGSQVAQLMADRSNENSPGSVKHRIMNQNPAIRADNSRGLNSPGSPSPRHGSPQRAISPHQRQHLGPQQRHSPVRTTSPSSPRPSDGRTVVRVAGGPPKPMSGRSAVSGQPLPAHRDFTTFGKPRSVPSSPEQEQGSSGSSCSSPRLVDEAYGTMGSNGGSSYKSTDTTSSCSSVGSANTVIAAPESMKPSPPNGHAKKSRRSSYEAAQDTYGSNRKQPANDTRNQVLRMNGPKSLPAGRPNGSPNVRVKMNDARGPVMFKVNDAQDGPVQKAVNHRGGGGQALPSAIKKPQTNATNNPVAKKNLHVTMLSMITVLGLMTGVYSQDQYAAADKHDQIQVHIKMHVPPGLIINGSYVVFNKNKDSQLLHEKMKRPLNIIRYDIENPHIANMADDKCHDTLCPQGCDPNTGKCLCSHGYILVGDFICKDVNECQQSPRVCDDNAECINTPGSYQCNCQSGYYGDGKICRDCFEPCLNDTFEVEGCRPGGQGKVCQDCRATCPQGQFVSGPCEPTHDIICAVCKPKCKLDQFEYAPCFGQQDRRCKDVLELPTPVVPDTVVFEDRQQAVQVFSHMIHQERAKPSIRNRELILDRGNGIKVKVIVKEANLAPLYQAVDHSQDHENLALEHVPQHLRERIATFCAEPMPSHYDLTLIRHRGVITKVQFCRQKSTDPNCKTNVGYYMTPAETCKTYGKFGPSPQLNPDPWKGHVLCTQTSKLARIFQMTTDFDDQTPLRFDPTRDCAERRLKCDECMKRQAQVMRNFYGSDPCNVTGDDADNGESPRLRLCYNCKNEDQCKEKCSVHYDEKCKQKRCAQGMVAEFLLDPKFGSKSTDIFCHISPVPDYKIYDLFYSVYKNDKLVLDKLLPAVRIHDNSSHHHNIDRHTFLNVHYGSNVLHEIDLLQGDMSSGSISAGRYVAQGRSLQHADIQSDSVTVIPKTPFGVTTNIWKNEHCDTDKMADLLISSGSVYRNLSELEIYPIEGRPGNFRIFNITDTSQAHILPFLYFEALKDESVLEPVFGPSSLMTDDSLSAELVRKDLRTWRITIKGQLQQCPGYVGVIITDPNYPKRPLFHYDLGVRCPTSFYAHFDVPTTGEDIMEKKFNVELKDSFRSVHIKLYRPAPNLQHEVYAGQLKLEDCGELAMHMFTPVLACFCVLIAFFTVMLALGYTTRTAQRAAQEGAMKRAGQHSWCVVVYVTFRTAYSLTMTLTVLLLLIRTINRESVSTLSQYQRYTDTWTTLQQTQLDQLRVFVDAELLRQNHEANISKTQCESRLRTVHTLVEETKKNLSMKGAKQSSLNSVSRVASQYTRVLVQNLTNSISLFREEFSAYAKGLVQRMTREISETSESLEGNAWLRPVIEIRKKVEEQRKVRQKSTKPLLNWLGLQQDLKRLSDDLSLSQFPLPNVNDFLAPMPNKSQRSEPRLNSELPQNAWIVDYNNHSDTDLREGGGLGELKSGRSPPDGRAVLSWDSLLLVAVLVDVLWFIHRMICTVTTARQMLYGCPLNIDCRKYQELDDTYAVRGRHRSQSQSHSKPKQCCLLLRNTNIKVMKTDYVPKLITVTTICVFIYMVVMTASNLLTLQTIASVGFFDTMIAPVVTAHNLAKTRIKTNAFRINKFEYPFHEELFNVRLKRYQLILDLYGSLYQANNILQTSEYCSWARLLDDKYACNCTRPVPAPKLRFQGCEFPPIGPHAYSSHNLTQFKEDVTHGMLVYVNAARRLVSDTTQLILIFIALVVLLETVSGVVWVYMKRFGLIRLKPVYEMDYTPEPAHLPPESQALKPHDSNGLTRRAGNHQQRLNLLHQEQDDSEDFPGPMWPPKNNHISHS